MKYLCILGKHKRSWFGVFPDFPGQIIVSASSQRALEAKLSNVLGAHLEISGTLIKPHFKSMKSVDPDLLEGLTDLSAVKVEAAMVNPVSLEVADIIRHASLSKAEIAKRMGTTQSVLSRLSDPKYSGHSVGVLRRLARATGSRLSVRFER